MYLSIFKKHPNNLCRHILDSFLSNFNTSREPKGFMHVIAGRMMSSVQRLPLFAFVFVICACIDISCTFLMCKEHFSLSVLASCALCWRAFCHSLIEGKQKMILCFSSKICVLLFPLMFVFLPLFLHSSNAL